MESTRKPSSSSVVASILTFLAQSALLSGELCFPYLLAISSAVPKFCKAARNIAFLGMRDDKKGSTGVNERPGEATQGLVSRCNKGEPTAESARLLVPFRLTRTASNMALNVPTHFSIVSFQVSSRIFQGVRRSSTTDSSSCEFQDCCNFDFVAWLPSCLTKAT